MLPPSLADVLDQAQQQLCNGVSGIVVVHCVCKYLPPAALCVEVLSSQDLGDDIRSFITPRGGFPRLPVET